MSQREVAIVGKNNTRAAVTGQEELLVKVNSASQGTARTASIYRFGGVVQTFPVKVNSAAIANVGTGNVTVNGAILKPGETVSFDAGDINNYFPENMFTVDCTASEILITFIN
jgi:hypothetical protein